MHVSGIFIAIVFYIFIFRPFSLSLLREQRYHMLIFVVVFFLGGGGANKINGEVELIIRLLITYSLIIFVPLFLFIRERWVFMCTCTEYIIE